MDGQPYLAQVQALFAEYALALNRDLTFQGFEEEVQNPAAKYAGEAGELLVALSAEGQAMGCVAYHRLNAQVCELKRLFVRPAYRHVHTGERLVKAIINRAKLKGYQEMVLDTIRPLKAAISLYSKLGFVECEPYYPNPMPDVIYLRLKL